MQGLILEYSDRCFQSLANNLLNVSGDCSIEFVHKLRLSIKKLHTLFKIINYNDGLIENSKTIKLIDRVFVNSGNLRDIQIQIKLLTFYGDIVGGECNSFILMLEKEKRKVEANLKRSIKRLSHFDVVLLNQRLDNTIEAADNGILEKEFRNRIEDQYSKIKQISNENQDENKLHCIRIMLKNLIYSFSMAKHECNRFEFSSAMIVYINKLQQKIGSWHDLKVLMERISKTESRRAEFIYLFQRISTDKNSIQTEIQEDLKEFNEMTLYKMEKGGYPSLYEL